MSPGGPQLEGAGPGVAVRTQKAREEHRGTTPEEEKNKGIV